MQAQLLFLLLPSDCMFCLDAAPRLEDLRSGSLLSGEAQGTCQLLGLEASCVSLNCLIIIMEQGRETRQSADIYSGWLTPAAGSGSQSKVSRR